MSIDIGSSRFTVPRLIIRAKQKMSFWRGVEHPDHGSSRVFLAANFSGNTLFDGAAPGVGALQCETPRKV
jgi:hypothetical protein